jgi:hypothetical protein
MDHKMSKPQYDKVTKLSASNIIRSQEDKKKNQYYCYDLPILPISDGVRIFFKVEPMGKGQQL